MSKSRSNTFSLKKSTSSLGTMLATGNKKVSGMITSNSRKASSTLVTNTIKVTEKFSISTSKSKRDGNYSTNDATAILNSNKDSILPRIEIEYTTPNQIFTVQHNKIKGRAHLKFVKDAARIRSINIGIKADCRTLQTNSSKAESKADQKRSRFDILFNKSTNVFTCSEDEEMGVDFPEGYSLEYPFNFDIPSDKIALPSSCENFGATSQKTAANISIKYELYIRIEYYSSLKKNSTFLDFLVPLKYQGDSATSKRSSVITALTDDSLLNDTTAIDDATNVSDVHNFKNKLKVYLPDKKLGGLIENKMTGAPANYIKKYWDEEHAKAIELSKDMRLSMFLQLPDYLMLDETLSDIPILFELPATCCTPFDLSYNGMSTKLGFFEIESIELVLIQSMKIQVSDDKIDPFDSTIETQLFKQRYSHKPTFDIKDFQFDSKSNSYVRQTKLGNFLSTNAATKIIDTLKNPFVNNVNLGEFFSCRNAVKFVFTIGTGESSVDRKQEYNSKRFEFTSYKSSLTYSSNCLSSCSSNSPKPSNTSSYDTEETKKEFYYYDARDNFSKSVISFHSTVPVSSVPEVPKPQEKQQSLPPAPIVPEYEEQKYPAPSRFYSKTFVNKAALKDYENDKVKAGMVAATLAATFLFAELVDDNDVFSHHNLSYYQDGCFEMGNKITDGVLGRSREDGIDLTAATHGFFGIGNSNSLLTGDSGSISGDGILSWFTNNN